MQDFLHAFLPAARSNLSQPSGTLSMSAPCGCRAVSVASSCAHLSAVPSTAPTSPGMGRPEDPTALQSTHASPGRPRSSRQPACARCTESNRECSMQAVPCGTAKGCACGSCFTGVRVAKRCDFEQGLLWQSQTASQGDPACLRVKSSTWETVEAI
jgi:hypothetical protein